ncbi:hypothetical protein [Microbulbifer sp. SSSA005]|uniref:hypothetical protein n=1 Tax=Microbulbifer sp. SSSA005 TaxID=3243378 RepID=UPI004039E0F0
MIPKELDDKTEGTIVERQSTFVRFVTAESHQYKINYIRKKEFLFDELVFRGVYVVCSHPLLTHYEEDTLDIYVSSRAENASALANEFSDMTRKEYYGWLTLDECFNSQCDIVSILDDGYGLLYSGPSGLGRKVISRLKECGISFSSQSRKLKSAEIPKVLIMGANIVLAEDFRVERERS